MTKCICVWYWVFFLPYVCPFFIFLCWTINWWFCKQNITWLRQSMRKRKAETVLSDTVGYYHRSKLCCLGIHVHYGVHSEMYIGIDSHLIDLSLCCIICSQIKNIKVLFAKPELMISPADTATAPHGLRIAQMSRQFSWPQRWADCPRSWKIGGSGGLCKNPRYVDCSCVFGSGHVSQNTD